MKSGEIWMMTDGWGWCEIGFIVHDEWVELVRYFGSNSSQRGTYDYDKLDYKICDSKEEFKELHPEEFI